MNHRIRWHNSMAIEPYCFDNEAEAVEWATLNYGPACPEWPWYVSFE